jgi:hypothetical protein
MYVAPIYQGKAASFYGNRPEVVYPEQNLGQVVFATERLISPKNQ